MNKEKYIGGSFALEDSSRFRKSEGLNIPFSWSSNNTIGFETGADAISWALKAELNLAKRPVYFPLHYCEETLDRIKKKVPNFQLFRYSEPSEVKDKRAIIIWNHFNGYNPVPEIFLSKEHVVIEDCVQSLQALQKRTGKFSITSLRKWLEIDLAITIGDFEYIENANDTSEYFKENKLAKKLKSLWKKGEISDEKIYLDQFEKAEKALKNEIIAFHSTDEFYEFDWDSIQNQRKENAQFILNYLKTKPIEIIGNSEMFVMIKLDKRDKLRSFLANRGIFAPVHWIDSQNTLLAGTLLSLPIDQRYNTADMERIIEALEDGFKFFGC
jgi:hypothetical protein